jgi:hypothetical protein
LRHAKNGDIFYSFKFGAAPHSRFDPNLFFLCHEKNIHAFATSTSLKKADQRTGMMLITQHQHPILITN